MSMWVVAFVEPGRGGQCFVSDPRAKVLIDRARMFIARWPYFGAARAARWLE
jgi:hypothetical protein